MQIHVHRQSGAAGPAAHAPPILIVVTSLAVLAVAASACNPIRGHLDPVKRAVDTLEDRGCDLKLLNRYIDDDLPAGGAQVALSKAGCTQRDLDTFVDAIDLSDCGPGASTVAYLLSQRYYVGEGAFARDYRRAFKYARVSAHCRNAWGQRNLAVLYLDGDGTPHNPTRALAWCWIHNSAEMHRVKYDEVGSFPWRLDCDAFADGMTRDERRAARRLRNDLYPEYRSTSPTGH